MEDNNGYFIFFYSLYFPKFSWHKIYFSTDSFINKYPLIVINMDKFHINLIMFIKVFDSFLLVLGHIQVGTSSQLSAAMNVVSKVRIFTKLQILSQLCYAQSLQFSSVQALSHVRLFATPWIAARQASLSITISRSSLRLTSIASVMPSSHLILGRPLLLLPPIPSSIRVFSNESTLRMRWPKYWSFSFSIIPSTLENIIKSLNVILTAAGIHWRF